MQKSAVRFIHASGANLYHFDKDHPFHPIRYQLTISLLKHAQALANHEIITPTVDNIEQLLHYAHHDHYIKMIKALSVKSPLQHFIDSAEQYGLHSDDTPYFHNMHEASVAIVAGTVQAVDEVASGRLEHAYHMAGGLHHAMPDRAAGFCIYNDVVIAIRAAQAKYDLKVLYIDTDVHHGDGVQLAFYADPTVCTYSIHETGKYLFPGTGYQYERGIEQGYGTTINVPLEPYTEDDSWLDSFQYTIEKTVAYYKPDMIISVHGCDAHAFDPLSHLHCSMHIYEQIPTIIHQLAHTYCNGKWVALGGGGYDLWRVVPRAWSHVWLTMNDHPLMREIIEARKQQLEIPLPNAWIELWSYKALHNNGQLPIIWQDIAGEIEIIPRREEITLKNRKIAEIAVQGL